MINRVLVRKRVGFKVEADKVLLELRDFLGIKSIQGVDIVNRYDIENISAEDLEKSKTVVLSEPAVDELLEELPSSDVVIATELLPGQFDMRANSASECIQLLCGCDRPIVRCAKIYLLTGELSDSDIASIKHLLINPVEMQEASLELPSSLQMVVPEVKPVPVIEGFLEMERDELNGLIEKFGLSMDADDIAFCQDYFRDERRCPTVTEIKVIDTYWSDHCRHTTFNTELVDIEIEDTEVRAAFERYLTLKKECGRESRPNTLMDIGTIAARILKKRGILNNLDESDEINACTIKAKVDVNGELQDWLYLFKNETHNHPTEIEPFGGAATCVGGAIRDPLSGRSYVYQSMRITGAANPNAPVEDTLEGKLPQRKICRGAADGFSSYGNQIGLATGIVDEIYHPGYLAKRMEIGAVVGAAPADAVVRETPADGDVVILLGGRTGRDGIGGATGSSKAHKTTSLETCGSEVQKGNAPTERKLQRLFRNKEASSLIVRCNDFGAGGVSVAIGELADGLDINLDAVPCKYLGLDGTEIAISESQERMACVIHPADVDKFLKFAESENLEATIVAKVTETPRMVQTYRGQRVVDLSRAFLDSNGAPKKACVRVAKFKEAESNNNDAFEEKFRAMLTDLNSCSKEGLTSMFDSTIGASTVMAPLGGENKATPAIAMVAKLPVMGETSTVSGMAWGYNPMLSSNNQYAGAYMAVVDSVCKLVCAGFSRHDMLLTFQEYFKKLGDNKDNWGQPFAAVLGALDAQIGLQVAAIGGKDSMSGTFDDISVPPTLVSFATALSDANVIISPELKHVGSSLIYVVPRKQGSVVNSASMLSILDAVNELIVSGKILSASTPAYNGLAESLFKMSLGNRIGVDLNSIPETIDMFENSYGSIILEVEPDDKDDVLFAFDNALFADEIGVTTSDFNFSYEGLSIDLSAAQEKWECVLDDVYPRNSKPLSKTCVDLISFDNQNEAYKCSVLLDAKPKVIIPVFPGTNCEYDTARAFAEAGADPDIFVIKNLTPEQVSISVDELSTKINDSQILMIPGGFSGGDEPDGSAKFIASFFRSHRIAEAITNLLEARDGLVLGICNGFQALLKLGLLPYGKIVDLKEDDPTLTYNLVGHHESALIQTRISSTLSPWMSRLSVGDIHTIAISHGEGRFVCNDEMLNELISNGQVCAQYVNNLGIAATDTFTNPNGSVANIESICSPDGRVLGKMGHSERRGNHLYVNVPGNKYQELFEGGVDYFSF